jgi:hypothetical protein
MRWRAQVAEETLGENLPGGTLSDVMACVFVALILRFGGIVV